MSHHDTPAPTPLTTPQNLPIAETTRPVFTNREERFLTVLRNITAKLTEQNQAIEGMQGDFAELKSLVTNAVASAGQRFDAQLGRLNFMSAATDKLTATVASLNFAVASTQSVVAALQANQGTSSNPADDAAVNAATDQINSAISSLNSLSVPPVSSPTPSQGTPVSSAPVSGDSSSSSPSAPATPAPSAPAADPSDPLTSLVSH